MKKTIAYLFALAATVALFSAGCCKDGGCSSGQPAAAIVPAELPTGKWMLLDAPGLSAENLKKPVGVSIEFKDGRIFGYGGVNNYFGPMHTENDAFRLGPMASTMKAGPGMDFEAGYLKALDRVTGFQIADDTLDLLDGETILFRYRRSN